MVISISFVAPYFLLLSAVSMILFGDVVLSSDTIIKVFYQNSHSILASLLQVTGICITIFHTPVLIFTMRESLLLLFYSCFKSVHRP